MADYSGALALQMPTKRCVYMGAGHREDQNIHIQSLGWEDDGKPASVQWPLASFYQSDGQLVPGKVFAELFKDCPWIEHIAGTFLALLESGEIPHYGGGVNLIFLSNIPVKAGLASSAAIQVATVKSLAGLFEVELDAHKIARVCKTANNNILNDRPGLVDHLTCLLGEADALLQIRCQPDLILGTLTIPQNLTIAGIDVGMRLDIYNQRYADNRDASLIGRFLIERMLKLSGAVGDPTGGYLANISPNEYVRRFRNELPVKLRGKDFLDYFGQPQELEINVQTSQIYKVRSRTEHHIYENDRTHRFMERLARVLRTSGRDALAEAGELMYASHWSYSQRCGMGSIETDILVNCIRQRGPEQGLYGAKVTAGGCGGTVAVLMENNANSKTALEAACAEYATKTGQTPTISGLRNKVGTSTYTSGNWNADSEHKYRGRFGFSESSNR
ncbi:MAG: GHMP family kinase ATP-binding protein [Planctomycetota bacterium]